VILPWHTDHQSLHEQFTWTGGGPNDHSTLAFARCIGIAGCDYGTPRGGPWGAGLHAGGSGSDFTPLPNVLSGSSVEAYNDGVQQPSVTLPSSVATTISSQMQALGYTRVPTDAEVGLRLAWEKTTYVYYSGGYWLDHWGYYGCWPTGDTRKLHHRHPIMVMVI